MRKFSHFLLQGVASTLTGLLVNKKELNTMAECLGFSEFVEQRMNALGLSTPSSLYDNYDQMLGKLAQVAAIATLNPRASVFAVRGALPVIAVAAAVGGVYYLAAYATSIFIAAVEVRHCKDINSAKFISWLRQNGIYDIEGIEAELMRNPRLRLAHV